MASAMISGPMDNVRNLFLAIMRLTKNLREQFLDELKGKSDMRFYGKVYKDGKFWLAELPLFDAMTQGRTRKEAYAMVADLLESLANRQDFKVTVHPGKHGDFEVSSTDSRILISLFLRRQRERSGLSLSEAAERLGAKSRNAYARYERGTSMPSLEKLTELYQAVAPGNDIVLHHSVIE
jgi:DNA-binding XRE family transcriptional regulator